ncbi:hypothetical protein HHK36_018461 [Tetracentron sinense]|uniref:Maternal effect embryo arrest 60 n=1 Tax=Tetracentron sinense TaxID=13715 RepID=A0A835DDK2_TETSI|nr:hypothetical protein HHK36_018461 [Tetracentron sinense]
MDDVSRRKFSTSIHITALDGIVNVNSLFTFAVFIGLAWNPNDPTNSLVDDPNCVAGSKIAEDLIAFHVYSFSSFLFSSLVALGLKQAIRIARSTDEVQSPMRAHVNKTVLRVGILVSAVGSVCGCGFLMLALVNVVQIKLGTLACRSAYSFGAIVPLVIFVPIALLIYVSIVLRVHVILNCADEEIFNSDFTHRKDFREKFGIPESRALVLGRKVFLFWLLEVDLQVVDTEDLGPNILNHGVCDCWLRDELHIFTIVCFIEGSPLQGLGELKMSSGEVEVVHCHYDDSYL